MTTMGGFGYGEASIISNVVSNINAKDIKILSATALSFTVNVNAIVTTTLSFEITDNDM
jgi:hypothetical protein